MQDRLKFGRDWILGDRMGGGGFGQVYAAQSDRGEPAVVKLVPKVPGASRELLFVNPSGVRNVIPIIDSGETEDSWALVMPRADKSLRDHLNKIGAALGAAEAILILKDIGAALVDLDGKVVHRDLKPENILLLNGAWCLADFGISRYAEASTAPDTHKYAMTAPYAAPERWRGERATSATDIYSFGVIAFELLSHSRPFPGPEPHDFRDQHLHVDPAPLTAGTAGLRALIGECLFKAPGARPSSANMVARLDAMGKARIAGLAKLEEANLAEVARRAEGERVNSEGRSVTERRSDFFKAAKASLELIAEALFGAIADAALMAQPVTVANRSRAVRLGEAVLALSPASETARSPWNWDAPAFDVVSHGEIVLMTSLNHHGYLGRSHSLWYCDAREEGRYRWFETAFMMPFNRPPPRNPFALEPSADAAKALWRGTAEFQLAWPLEPIDTSDLDAFVDRWASWFGEASQGRLRHPSQMPERETARNWRER